MGKNEEASLFQRFVIMLFGLGVVLVGAYPLTKKHGGIKKYLENKFYEGKEISFKDIFSLEKGAEYFTNSEGASSTSRSTNKSVSKNEKSRAIFWSTASPEEVEKNKVREELERKKRIIKAEDHLNKDDREELNSLLNSVPE